MNVNYVLFFALFAASTGREVAGTIKPPALVEDLLQRLRNEEWAPREAECSRDTVALLQGVGNHTLWAMWAWNSMQLPTGTFYGSKYNFGNFDQCLQAPWASSHPGLQMQYCLVKLKLSNLKEYYEELTDPYGDAEKYIEMKSFYGRQLNTLFLGVCLPSSCKPESIAKITRHIYQLSQLPFEEVNVDHRDCQVPGQELERTTEFYIFWWIILIMVLVCLVVYFTGVSEGESDSIVFKILRCFCLNRNFDALTEISKDEIRMMHGIRAVTCGIITVTHCFLMTFTALINHATIDKVLKDRYGRFLLHIDICVDTFFVMSGLLHIKSLLSSNSSKPIKVIFKRYIRLIFPVYVLAVMCFGHVLPHLGSGPAWPLFSRKEYEPCTRSWWKNFLMIGNDVGEHEYCIFVTWYTHCDFHFTILGTAIFMAYKMNKARGFIVWCVLYVLSFAIPTFINYWNKLPGIVLYNFGESLETATNKVFNTVYVKSYNRASSYLIGIAMGYLLTQYKPKDYRRSISKVALSVGANGHQCMIVFHPQSWSMAGFSLAMFAMLLMLEVGAASLDWQRGVLTSILMPLDRSIWALAICLIIAVCEYGTLPIINDFLTWKVFVPLSKLCYAGYMWHTAFLNRNFYSLRTPLTFDIFHLIANGLGYIVMLGSFCFLFWLFIEAPVTNLINLLFDNRTKKSIRNGVAQQNGFKIEKTF